MGSIADCFGYAMIESFWSRMQVELLDRQRWKTRIKLTNAIFEYLEIWHNRRRRHSLLGWLSPLQFEDQRMIVAVQIPATRLRRVQGIPGASPPLRTIQRRRSERLAP
jgi:transposase InsO family protein